MKVSHEKLLPVAVCGNLLCWGGDLLLSFFPGKEMVSGLAISSVWANAPLWRFSLSGILGGIAMMAVLCGFYAVYNLLKPQTPKAAAAFMIGGLLSCIPGAVFHMQCTSTAWIYDKLGGTKEAAEIAMDFFTQYLPLMILCTVGIILSCVILVICVICRKTPLPRWAAVFNIVAIMTVLSCLKPLVTIPGTMNLSGAGMFLGIWLCLRKKDKTDEPAR